MRAQNVLGFLGQSFVGPALGPSLAHLFALPNKVRLERPDYITVQRIHRGWALAGIPVVGALLAATTQFDPVTPESTARRLTDRRLPSRP